MEDVVALVSVCVRYVTRLSKAIKLKLHDG